MAMYLPLGPGRYQATEHTQGPWDPRHQHLGPVTALMVHALPPGLPVAKIAVDVFAPVPVGVLDVTTRLVKDGKRVQCASVVLSAEGRELVHMTAWRIRESVTSATAAAPPPGEGSLDTSSWLATGFGYGKAMEWRFTSGSAMTPGPATVWGRVGVPLVEGEEITPLERLVILADSGNGVSNVLDFDAYLFANVDLAISLFREPVGEWMCMEAATSIGPAGRGLARTRLFDAEGEVGASMQTLFVGPRA